MGRLPVVAALAVLLLGAAACGEEEAAGASASQEDYEELAAGLCERHGPTLAQAYSETRPDSDAEEAGFYLSELIPRGRDIVNRLGGSLPPERAADYAEALNEALAVLGELEAQPYRYIDQRHARSVPPEEDLLVRLQNAFKAADIPC